VWSAIGREMCFGPSHWLSLLTRFSVACSEGEVKFDLGYMLHQGFGRTNPYTRSLLDAETSDPGDFWA
jgi:hypothetical protein